MAFDYDLEHPVLINPTHQYARQGLDNPDAVYFNAYLTEGASYLVSGRRGTTVDLSFQIMDGTYSDAGAPNTVAAFDDRELDVAADGTFEWRFGPELGLRKGSTLIVREVYDDWNAEERGTLRIQRLDTAGRPRRGADPGAGREAVRRRREDADRPDQHLVRVPRVVHLQGAGQHPDRPRLDARRAGLAVLLDRALLARRRRGAGRDRPGVRRGAVPGHPDRQPVVRLHRLRAPPDIADPGAVRSPTPTACCATSSASATRASPTGSRPAATRRA